MIRFFIYANMQKLLTHKQEWMVIYYKMKKFFYQINVYIDL